MRRRAALPLVQLSGAFAPRSMNAEQRTVQLIWKTSTPVLRSSFFDGDYMLEMPLKPENVRMERLQSGAAPLLASHRAAELEAVLGVIESASIDGKVGRATARFSERPEADAIFRDVQAGILKAVSVGARIHKLEEVKRGKGDELPVFRASDWEPLEVSVVSINGDAGAVFLADEARTHECFITGGTTMRLKKCPSCKVKLSEDVEETCPECDVNLEEAEAERDELVQAGKIHRYATHFELGDVWAQKHIKAKTPADEALADATRERAKRSPQIDGRIDITAEYDSPAFKLEAMAEGLAARARGVEPSAPGRRYYHSSLVELGYEVLAWRGHHRGLDPRRDAGRIVQLTLTTSDYPLLLANTGSKVLAVAYEAAAPVYRLLARRQDLPDFKLNSYLQVGDFPVLLQVGEGGEITLGSFSESGETWMLATYGRITSFSRQAIINDDLNAFQRMMQGAGQRAAQVENGLFFALLTSGTSNNGPTLADSVQFFASAAWPTGHANLASSGAAIDVTSLGAGRAAMQKQTSLDGLKLNLVPRLLVTSPDKRTIAEQYTTQITPAQPSSVNPFPGRLEVVSDANLPSANPWYLFADPAALPAAVYGHLASAPGPRIETRVGFEVEGLDFKCAIDWACAFVEPRAAWRNPGA